MRIIRSGSDLQGFDVPVCCVAWQGRNPPWGVVQILPRCRLLWRPSWKGLERRGRCCRGNRSAEGGKARPLSPTPASRPTDRPTRQPPPVWHPPDPSYSSSLARPAVNHHSELIYPSTCHRRHHEVVFSCSRQTSPRMFSLRSCY
jgi:hypothetical protein